MKRDQKLQNVPIVLYQGTALAVPKSPLFRLGFSPCPQRLKPSSASTVTARLEVVP